MKRRLPRRLYRALLLTLTLPMWVNQGMAATVITCGSEGGDTQIVECIKVIGPNSEVLYRLGC